MSDARLSTDFCLIVETVFALTSKETAVCIVIVILRGRIVDIIFGNVDVL